MYCLLVLSRSQPCTYFFRRRIHFMVALFISYTSLDSTKMTARICIVIITCLVSSGKIRFTNDIVSRVTKIFSDALKLEKNPLVAYYGAISGLQVNFSWSLRSYEFISSVSNVQALFSNPGRNNWKKPLLCIFQWPYILIINMSW